MRTQNEILEELKINFVNNATIQQRYGLVAGQSFDEQFSKLSLEGALFHVLSYSIWILEGSISLTVIRGMMAGTKSERLLLQAGNLLSPTNIAGNPSNWIASPNMKEVKLFGMPNDVDTTIGYGQAGAITHRRNI